MEENRWRRGSRRKTAGAGSRSRRPSPRLRSGMAAPRGARVADRTRHKRWVLWRGVGGCKCKACWPGTASSGTACWCWCLGEVAAPLQADASLVFDPLLIGLWC